MFRLTLTGSARDRLQKFVDRELEAARQEAVRNAMRETLADVVRFNPVDTARSRAAWVDSLQKLGGAPPPGWQGPHPSAVEEGARLADLATHHDRDTTDIAAASAVDYVHFLEYGTSRMPPFAMIRRALLNTRRRLRHLFR